MKKLIKRALAFGVDTIILGLSAILLSTLFSNVLLEIGGNLWYIGFIICGIYFTLLTSKIGKGQTVGMSIVKLKLVNHKNEHVTPANALGRYSILSIVLFPGISESLYSATNCETTLSIFIIIRIFLFISIIGLMAITKERQGLHDYISKAFVIDTKHDSDIEDISRLKELFSNYTIRIIILSLIFIVLATASIMIPRLIEEKAISTGTDLNKMTELKETLDHNEYLSNTIIKAQWSKKGGADGQMITTKNFIIGTNIKYSVFKDKEKSEELFDVIKNIVELSYEGLNKYDNLVIVQSAGYNIGIANLYMRQNKVFNLKDPNIAEKKGICGPNSISEEHNQDNCNKFCESPEDCKYTCGCGAINKDETCNDEGIVYDCVNHEVSCENYTCTLGEESTP